MNKKYSDGKLPIFVRFLAERFNFGSEYAMALLITNFPELKDKTRCANCDASMAIYSQTVDGADCALLLAMAEHVEHRLTKTRLFSEANVVHVTSLPVTHATKCRTTMCRTHGLIAKVRDATGTHVPGTWLITKRGWSFLRGEPVPRTITVFRNKVDEHKEDEGTITMKEILRDYRGAEKLPDNNPKRWYEIEKYFEGRLGI